MTGDQGLGPAHEYFRDAWQRSIPFLDILRQRGNVCCEQQAKTAANVLEFDAELILEGRTLARPVNYGLVRILAQSNAKTDPTKRPCVVVDPRAGHGIGGMKKDSEIGAALGNGHQRAMAAIPKLHPRDPEDRARTLRAIQRIALVPGDRSKEGKRRLARIEKLFGTKAERAVRKEDSDVRT